MSKQVHSVKVYELRGVWYGAVNLKSGDRYLASYADKPDKTEVQEDFSNRKTRKNFHKV